MKIFRWVAVALLALVTACAGSPLPRPVPASAPAAVSDSIPPSPKRPSFPLERPRAELVEELDRIIQGRFLNVREEDLKKRNFGPKRMATLETTHPRGLLRKDLPEIRPILEKINVAGWTWASYVAEARRDGIGTIVGPIVEEKDSWKLFADVESVRSIAQESASKRTGVQGEAAGLLVEARPIVASDELCLRCHRRRQLGEPLGVIVYSFRSIRPWIPTTGE